MNGFKAAGALVLNSLIMHQIVPDSAPQAQEPSPAEKVKKWMTTPKTLLYALLPSY
ncbi:MAG: hypothetical protein Q7U84_00655 [Polynucleobacter sp.]|nr:hypothetical protein [Polynucleobacter sp.]